MKKFHKKSIFINDHFEFFSVRNKEDKCSFFERYFWFFYDRILENFELFGPDLIDACKVVIAFLVLPFFSPEFGLFLFTQIFIVRRFPNEVMKCHHNYNNNDSENGNNE